MALRRRVTIVRGIAMKVHPDLFRQSEKIREFMSKKGINIGQVKSTGILARRLRRRL